MEKSSILDVKVSVSRFGRRKISTGNVPCNSQLKRLSVVNEEEQFIKDQSETEDMSTKSRWSSLGIFKFLSSLLTTNVSRLTKWFWERSSEANRERCDKRSGTWLEDTQPERLRYLNLVNWPNPGEINEKSKSLKARYVASEREERGYYWKGWCLEASYNWGQSQSGFPSPCRK